MKSLRRFGLSCFTLASVIGLVAATSRADNDTPGKSDLAKVADFLRENVVGKTLETRITETIDSGRIEAVFARRRTFANLRESKKSLVFDVIVVIEQTNYDLDKDGRRKAPGYKKDRVLVDRYEIRRAASTGALLGICHNISSSPEDLAGAAASVRLTLEGGKLVFDEVTVGYDDYFTQGNKFKPAVGETRRVISLVNKKVKMTDDTTSYDVDPRTFLKRSGGTRSGTLVGKEVD